MLKTVLFCVVWNVQIQAHNPKNLGTQATHGRSNYMAKVTLGGTINIQGTKEIDRTNLAQLREPTNMVGKWEGRLWPHCGSETAV